MIAASTYIVLFATLIGTDNVVESREFDTMERCQGYADILNQAEVGYYGNVTTKPVFHVGDLTFHCEKIEE